LPTGHIPFLTATLCLSWDALDDPEAQHVIQTAALLGEAVQVPRPRLALLSGLPDQARPGYPTPLEKALAVLQDYSLVEKLSADEIRLHPLVREFTRSKIPDREAFARQAAANLAGALWGVGRLESEIIARGVDAVLEDLQIADALAPSPSSHDPWEVRPLLRTLDRDAHYFRDWDAQAEPAFVLQQWRNRCCQ